METMEMDATRRSGSTAVLLLSLLSLGSFSGAFAQAYGPTTIDYARSHNVSLAEAQDRISKVRDIARFEKELATYSPETFAGLFIEHEPNFRVVVKFVGDAKAQLARFTNNPLFVAQSAPRSLELLIATQAHVADQLARDSINFESGLSLERSEVDFYVLDPFATSRKLSAILNLAPFVRLRKTSGFIETTSIVGGRRADGATFPCTTGFNTVDTNRELGIVTAGHCEDALVYAQTSTQLVFQSERWQGDYDVQWHKQRVTQSTTPKKQENKIDLIQGPTQTVDVTSTTPSSGYVVGAPVCKSGISGYFMCGKVADKNALADNRGMVGSFIRARAGFIKPFSLTGDSGGPVFVDNSAYGIVHGRGAPNTPTRNDLYFVPIERLSALNISVLTDSFEITSIPDASGPNNQVVPMKVNFKGTPRFPVSVTVDVLSCPSPWVCRGGTAQATNNVPSPLTLGWVCDGDPGLPTTSFNVRTTLEDASLIKPQSVNHVVTCTAVSPGAPNSTTKEPPNASASFKLL